MIQFFRIGTETYPVSAIQRIKKEGDKTLILASNKLYQLNLGYNSFFEQLEYACQEDSHTITIDPETIIT